MQAMVGQEALFDPVRRRSLLRHPWRIIRKSYEVFMSQTEYHVPSVLPSERSSGGQGAPETEHRIVLAGCTCCTFRIVCRNLTGVAFPGFGLAGGAS